MQMSDHRSTAHNANSVRLTGRVPNLNTFPCSEGIEWDLERLNESGSVTDGDIVIQGMLDEMGRLSVRGRNTNMGYSGYVRGWLYHGGAKRRILNWKKLFPEYENEYKRQMDKKDAAARVAKVIENLKGCFVYKVKGGWIIDIPQTSGDKDTGD